MKRTLFMETTTVDASRTAGEIRLELLKAGATKIMDEYDSAGGVLAMTFSIPSESGDLPFRLPVRVDPVFRILNGRRKSWDRSQHAAKDLAQAKRVAWRQLLRWIQAQVAMIQTGMVETREVFLPYMTNGQQTLYEVMESKGYPLMLNAGRGAE